MKKFIYACALAAASLATPGFDAQAETWKPLGTGYLRDDIITVSYILSDYYEFEVEIQESEETPGRYRLVNAYRNCPRLSEDVFPEDATNYLIVDASDPVHVYIEQGGTSYYIGQDQQLCLWSIADDYYNNKYGNWTLADEEGVCGKLEDGIITFPRGSVLFVPLETLVFNPDDYDVIWRVANKQGMFRIMLPGVPRTDIDASLMGISDDQTAVNYYINLDPDIEYVQAAVFEGQYDAAMAERIRKTADGTATDAEKVVLTKFSKSGITSFPNKHWLWCLTPTARHGPPTTKHPSGLTPKPSGRMWAQPSMWSLLSAPTSLDPWALPIPPTPMMSPCSRACPAPGLSVW